MNTFAAASRLTLQRSLCMLLAISVVSLGLGMGALGVHAMTPQGYSVTITQLA